MVFGIGGGAFPRGLSSWSRSGAEGSRRTFRGLGVGWVPFGIVFLEGAWYHCGRRLAVQCFTRGHVGTVAFSGVFRLLKLGCLGNWEP